MNHRLPPLLSMPLLCLILAACTDSPPPAEPTASPGSGYVAVARGQIDVPGGLLQVTSPIEGSLTRVAVEEGDHVHRDQLLAQFDDTQARAARDTAKAQLEQAGAELKLLTLQQQAARQRARLEQAAADAGAGAGQTAAAAASQVAQLGARIDAARASEKVARAHLDSARHRLAQHALRAPFDADVIHVRTQAGAHVTPDSGTLFVLLPDRQTIVRAEINASLADAIHPGMRANVVFEDAPQNDGFPASVIRVAPILSVSTLDEDPTLRATERTVACVLKLDPPARLRVGRRVLVRFLKPRESQAQPASP